MVIAGTIAVACGLLLQGQPSLSQTSEWQMYRMVLQSMPEYRVTVRSLLLLPDGADRSSVHRDRLQTITVGSDGEAVVDTEDSRIYFVGRQRLAYSRGRGSSSTPITSTEVTQFAFLEIPGQGYGFAPMAKGASLQRLTRSPFAATRSHAATAVDGTVSGWAVSGSDGENVFTVEYWFDPQTYLVSRVVESARGRTLNYRCEHEYRWERNPKLPPDFFNPKPVPAVEAISVLWKDSRIVYQPMSGVWPENSRIIIIVPPGVLADIKVVGSQSSARARNIQESLAMNLTPGRYSVSVGGSSIETSIGPGFQAEIRLGGIVSGRRHGPISILDSTGKKVRTIAPNGIPTALLPGVYHWQRGNESVSVVVTAGKIAKL